MPANNLEDFDLPPSIVLAEGEHRQLTVLALAGTGHLPDVADSLLQELERAEVVPDAMVPSDAIRMGSRVRYRARSGKEQVVEVVYPADADIAQGRISVLTPVGTALIGLRRGQSMVWLTRNGRREALTVLEVTPPLTGDSGPAAA